MNSHIWLFSAWLLIGKPCIVGAVSWLIHFRSEKAPLLVRQIVSQTQETAERRKLYLLATDPLVFIILVYFNAFQFAPNSWVTALTTFLIMFIWVDFWMYANHWLMHRFSLFRSWHQWHHFSRVPRPASALSFSLREKLICYSVGWLLFAAAASWWIPVSVAGLVVFYSFYFVASTLAHANLDILHGRRAAINNQIIGSTATHCLHHVYADCNFGFFTVVYDRLFGTTAKMGRYATFDIAEKVRNDEVNFSV